MFRLLDCQKGVLPREKNKNDFCRERPMCRSDVVFQMLSPLRRERTYLFCLFANVALVGNGVAPPAFYTIKNVSIYGKGVKITKKLL